MRRSASEPANASEPVGRKRRATQGPPSSASARLARAGAGRLAAGHPARALLGARSRLRHTGAARGRLLHTRAGGRRTLRLVRLLLLSSEELVEEAHVVSLIGGVRRSITEKLDPVARRPGSAAALPKLQAWRTSSAQ